MPAELPRFTRGEEIANSVTHGIGAGLSLLGTGILLFRAAREGSAVHLASFSIYGTTLVLLHTASTLYHAVSPSRLKRALRVADHCSIFLLIAGTYTPFVLLSLWGGWLGTALLTSIWSMAAIGVAFKVLFMGRLKRLSVAFYVLMGWLIVVAARELWLRVPHQALLYVAVGGLMYTVGVVFYSWRRPYHHAVWHLFVLGGSVSHYLAVLLYLSPTP
ncbi:MAG: hemolysin III family protein [Candidatus Bipolaricaulota bacterium]